MGRFAPSTTGPAHPGTLLAGLLCWLDARSQSGAIHLRLEDLDPQRSQPKWEREMVEALAWLGLDWDSTCRQSDGAAAHEQALDALAAGGWLYPCSCSRSRIRADGEPAPDGGWRYANHCRDRELPPLSEGGWRSCGDALRVRLSDAPPGTVDEGGEPAARTPAEAFGDPVVRRRDGAIAYHLASVVDDRELGVDRIVRGRDLAASTGIQVALQHRLGYPAPRYRHHLLLLEERGGKFAKLHGAVGYQELRRHHAASELCGRLAHAAGLVEVAEPVTPQALLEGFGWERVAARDRVMRWTGSELVEVGEGDL